MNRVVAKNVTAEGISLLDVIKAAGDDGLTRRELEAGIGKKLNRWSLAQLELLASEGQIIVEVRQVQGKLFSEYVYWAI